MSQVQQIHTRLRDMVLSLDLGPGERLSERLLEREFNGSRTPVRAALLKLEAEGLVRRDGRNWVVAPIDLGEIAALAEFRLPLEETAVRLACERATAEDIDAVEALLDRCQPGMPREEWHQTGTDFHILLGRLSGNPFLARAIEDVMIRLSRPRWLEVWPWVGWPAVVILLFFVHQWRCRLRLRTRPASSAKPQAAAEVKERTT